MKRNITLSLLLAFLLVVSLPITSSAQNYHQAITIEPLQFLYNHVLTVTYEQQIAPKNSFTVNAAYMTLSTWASGLSVGGSYRFYLMQEKERAIKGFSFGPTISATFWSVDNSYYNYEGGTAISIGAEANYKWILEDGWTVEPTFRLFFPLNNLEGYGGWNTWGFGANVGYAW